MICSCCGNVYSNGGTLVTLAGSVFRLCMECIDSLWLNRHPDMEEARDLVKEGMSDGSQELWKRTEHDSGTPESVDDNTVSEGSAT
jgi:hypothetical protein